MSVIPKSIIETDKVGYESFGNLEIIDYVTPYSKYQEKLARIKRIPKPPSLPVGKHVILSHDKTTKYRDYCVVTNFTLDCIPSFHNAEIRDLIDILREYEGVGFWWGKLERVETRNMIIFYCTIES